VTEHPNVEALRVSQRAVSDDSEDPNKPLQAIDVGWGKHVTSVLRTVSE